MFKVISLACFISVGAAWADPLPSNYAIQCANSVAEVNLWSDGKQVHFELDDNAGFQNFPIYDGTVTPAMLALVDRGATDLKALDGHVEIAWDAKGCSYDPKRPRMMTCNSPGTFIAPKIDSLKVYSMETSTTHEETIEISADVLAVRVTMFTNEANPVAYFLAFPFNADNCTSNQSHE